MTVESEHTAHQEGQLARAQRDPARADTPAAGNHPALLPGPGGAPADGRQALDAPPFKAVDKTETQDRRRAAGPQRNYAEKARTGGIYPHRHRLPGAPHPDHGGQMGGAGGMPAALPPGEGDQRPGPVHCRGALITRKDVQRRTRAARSRPMPWPLSTPSRSDRRSTRCMPEELPHVPRPLRPRGPPRTWRTSPPASPPPTRSSCRACWRPWNCCRGWRRCWCCSTMSWNWPGPGRRSARWSKNKMETQQREFFLREQLKVIQKELGISKDDRTADIDPFAERLRAGPARRWPRSVRNRRWRSCRSGNRIAGVRADPQRPGLADATARGSTPRTTSTWSARARPSNKRPLRPGRRQKAHPRIPRRGHPQGRGQRLHRAVGGPARGRQDLAR